MLQPSEIIHYGLLGFYLCTDLFVGLEFVFGHTPGTNSRHALFTRAAGLMLLIDVISIIIGAYLVPIFPQKKWLVDVDYLIDIVSIVCMFAFGYTLADGHRLRLGKFLKFSIPMALTYFAGFLFEDHYFWGSVFFNLVTLVFFVDLLWNLHQHDKHLPLFYADTEHHRLSWFFYFVLWILVVVPLCQMVSSLFVLNHWFNDVLYLAMVAMLIVLARKLFIYEAFKLSQSGDELKQAVKVTEPKETKAIFSDEKIEQMKQRLNEVMEQEKLYTNPDLCVDDLVSRLGTNSAYFYYFMRDVMHTRFYDMVKGYRMQEAQRLLQTDMSIDQVALACGYYSASSFTRVFKEVVGQTPTQWRAQHKAE